MRPGPGRRAQRATRSRPYIRRDTSRRLGELWSPGGSSRSSPLSGAGAIDTALLRGDEEVPPILSGRLGLVLRGEELIQPPGAELGIVRKLDLSQSCFSLNFLFSYVLCNFLLCFPLLTYSQSFFSLSADHPRYSRRRRSKISILLIQETV